MILIGDLLSNNRQGALYRKFASIEEAYKAPWVKAREKYGVSIPSKRFCGVEIEVENINGVRDMEETDLRNLEDKYSEKMGSSVDFLFEALWRKENDGSLRNNGSEFITRLGTTFADASVSVPLLGAYLEMFEREAEANARTGLHVHVDVRDWKLKDLQRFLMIYLVFEQALFNYSGARQGSLFCVPLADTDFPIDELPGIHTREALEHLLRSHAKKYMGLNLLPLVSQGTIEFRMHKGTINVIEINRWLYIISSLVAVTEQIEDNEEVKSIILNMRKANLVDDFGKAIFGEAYPFLKSAITSEEIKKGVDKVKEMLVDLEAIPESYTLPEKRKYKSLARGRANNDLVFGDVEVGVPIFGADLAPLRRAGARALEDNMVVDFVAEDDLDPIPGPPPNFIDHRLPNKARNLPEEYKRNIIRLRQEQLDEIGNFWTDSEGHRLPGVEVPAEARVRFEDSGLYVHSRTQICIWDIVEARSRIILALDYDAQNNIFLYVRNHWRAR